MRENVVPSWREREERACGMKKKKKPCKANGARVGVVRRRDRRWENSLGP
jgi:hypothetical protein